MLAPTAMLYAIGFASIATDRGVRGFRRALGGKEGLCTRLAGVEDLLSLADTGQSDLAPLAVSVLLDRYRHHDLFRSAVSPGRVDGIPYRVKPAACRLISCLKLLLSNVGDHAFSQPHHH